MVACVLTEKNHYKLFYVKFFSFFSTNFLRRLWTDFLETLPQDVALSAAVLS